MKQSLAGWLWLKGLSRRLLMRDESDDITNPAAMVNRFAAGQNASIPTGD
jgi:hypothetical protein